MSETLTGFIFCSWICPLFSQVDLSYPCQNNGPWIPLFIIPVPYPSLQMFPVIKLFSWLLKSWIIMDFPLPVSPHSNSSQIQLDTFLCHPFLGWNFCLPSSTLLYASPFPCHSFYDKIKFHFTKVCVYKARPLLILLFWRLLYNTLYLLI